MGLRVQKEVLDGIIQEVDEDGEGVGKKGIYETDDVFKTEGGKYGSESESAVRRKCFLDLPPCTPSPVPPSPVQKFLSRECKQGEERKEEGGGG